MRDAFQRCELLKVVWSTLTLKDDPMLNVNANLFFFAYMAVVIGICPICERLANHFSK